MTTIDDPELRPKLRSSNSSHPERPAGPSTRFALIAVAIIVAVFLVGMLGLIFTGGSVPVETNPNAPPKPVQGAGLPASPAAAILQPIVAGGNPPGDVIDSMVVPSGASATPDSARDYSVETYDHAVSFVSGATQAQIVTFYKAELPANGWTSVSQVQRGQAVGFQAQHASNDGDYWGLELMVDPTSFSTSPVSGRTSVTLRLFVQSDQ